ncbi:IDEAL domain-containing protein [Cytobacillus solani]|uniref:IDEAL domain-containing protein n=1 Tax=Cytobacillus solani TaxID=1637975 RepID=UPI0020793991|nr:IDEAL domain-containing protein [Cytobacillus solani]USK54388.1 IDEAL domain-containing protein [Cytobacillus solani]
MEVIEKRIAPGEWIRVTHCRIRGYTGYVLKYDIVDDVYKVHITKNRHGERVSVITKIDSDCLVEYWTFTKEDDLLAMIDLALDTNDKEWFEELSALLPQPLPF